MLQLAFPDTPESMGFRESQFRRKRSCSTNFIIAPWARRFRIAPSLAYEEAAIAIYPEINVENALAAM
jgi:hypothetical protein